MTRKERFEGVIAWFSANMPVAETELHYRDPFQLLVAVILSAQCTDKRVNMVTPPLFERFPDVRAMAAASEEEIFSYIRSVSYPNNKARHLLAMARMVVEKFGGEVPGTSAELQQLPGVGRKTANVMLSVAFDTPAMAVDTHVFRVTARIGLTAGAKNPLQTEKQLVEYIPRDKLSIAHHWLILHGRYVCTARKPKCPECGIRNFCKKFQADSNKEEKASLKK